MIYLQLFLEFCRVGVFSVGGGLSTIPFLTELGVHTGWFTSGQLADMIAISESTPGPLGVNMSTYVGFHTAGLLGGLVSTVGLVAPSVVVILLVARILHQFRQARCVNAIFYGLRAASVALITLALLQVAVIALGGQPSSPLGIHWMGVLLAAVVFILIRYTPGKKLHPIVFIGCAALVGIVFQM